MLLPSVQGHEEAAIATVTLTSPDRVRDVLRQRQRQMGFDSLRPT